MGSLRVWTQLSNFTFIFHFHALEKEITTHSSVLAWRIPWMEELHGLQSMGHKESTQLRDFTFTFKILVILGMLHS